jgi:cell division protein FtsB
MDEFPHGFWETFKGMALTAAVLVLLGAAGYSFLLQGRHRDMTLLDTKVERVSLEVEAMRNDNRRLRLLITSLRDSDDLTEKIAREDSGLIKNGEILYIFPH